MAKCGMTEEALVPYNTFTHEVGEVAKYWFDLIFQGVKPFEGIHDHEGVAFMSIKF